jgi:hypothetical protein
MKNGLKYISSIEANQPRNPELFHENCRLVPTMLLAVVARSVNESSSFGCIISSYMELSELPRCSSYSTFGGTKNC